MKKLARFIIWSIVFLSLLVVLDRTLVYLDLEVPAYREVRSFYLDFRSRLFGLTSAQAPPSIEAVIESAPPEHERGRGGEPTYVYVDEQGELHFADRFEDIPERFRKEAEKLGQ